jgi:hypothetical protein
MARHHEYDLLHAVKRRGFAAPSRATRPTGLRYSAASLGDNTLSDLSEKIDYLVSLKLGVDDLSKAFDFPQLEDDIIKERSKWENRTEEEIDDEIEMEEMLALSNDHKYRKEKEEQDRFFNQPSATADFSAWSVIGKWTLDQTTALLLGKEPTVVLWEKVSEQVEVSQFARTFAKLRVYLGASGIEFPVSPDVFIECAEHKGIPVPPKLVELVRAMARRATRPELRPPTDQAQRPEQIVAAPDAVDKAAEGPSGTLRIAVRCMLLKKYGVTKPIGVTKTTAFEVIKAEMRDLRMDLPGRKTFDRSWNDLYRRSK